MIVPPKALDVFTKYVTQPTQADFLGPFHLTTCSTLLGTQFFQSFINTKVCYQALPRSAFTTLQKHLFPIYFRVQSVLVLTTIITYPLGPRSLLSSPEDLVPLSLAGITACVNFLVFGPQRLTKMICCIHQGRSSFVRFDNDGSTEDSQRRWTERTAYLQGR
ncbi:hypothetical protein EV126DRAFT_196108 [Verticillium dahliae]|nr:hypothetical protein EV126DRAFT_196108 [Verticillium dahliae]